MKKKLFLSYIIIISSVMVFNSCKKKTEVDSETQTVVDNAICEQQFMSVGPTINERGAGSPKAQGFKISGCNADWQYLGAATGTVNLATDSLDVNPADGTYDNGPVKFMIDYTSNLCGAPIDGVVKTGSITIVSTGKWSTLPSIGSVTVTLNNYKADGITYTGTIIITKPNANAITTQVINGHCTNGTWHIDYQCNKTLTNLGNGDFSIYGTSSGKNRDGRNFTTNVSQSTPIVKKASCKYISSGVMDVTPDGFKTRTVDFGSGACDDQATFTVNGQTVAFTLK